MIARRRVQSLAAVGFERRRRAAVFGLVSLAASLLVSVGEAGKAVAENAPAQGARPPVAVQPILLAQEGGTEPRELEPRYQPPPPGTPGPFNEQERDWYNSDYLFGMSRGLARSTIAPAGKVPLFLFTVPLDIVLFPFALIGGFFG